MPSRRNWRIVEAFAPSSAPLATLAFASTSFDFGLSPNDEERFGERCERPIVFGIGAERVDQPSSDLPCHFGVASDQGHGGRVDARIVTLAVLVEAMVGVEGGSRLLLPVGGARGLERLLLEEAGVERGDVLDELSLSLCLASISRGRGLTLVLAIAVIDEGF